MKLHDAIYISENIILDAFRNRVGTNKGQTKKGGKGQKNVE